MKRTRLNRKMITTLLTRAAWWRGIGQLWSLID
jgi:hypothetical protein